MREVDVICFWCGEAKGVAEVEDDFGDGPAFAEYIPCGKCATRMIRGITLVGMEDKEQFEGQESFGSHYPTGSWAVIDESWVRQSLPEGEFKDNVLEKRIMLMKEEELSELLEESETDRTVH